MGQQQREESESIEGTISGCNQNTQLGQQHTSRRDQGLAGALVRGF